MTVLGLLTTTYGAPSAREDLESLLLGVAAGDSHSLEELYHRTRTAVYGLVLSYLKHPQDAEDVTQDAFVRIWDTAASYRPQGKPMAWLLTVARNLALMRLRERGKTQELTDEEWATYCKNVQKCADRCAANGFVGLFHPHVDSHVQTEKQIERFLNDTNVDLCFDTGHHVYGGGEPISFYKKWAKRIPYIHFKDCDLAVKAKMDENKWSFAKAVTEDIMVEPGKGSIDFTAMHKALDECGYDGWCVVEQDLFPVKSFDVPLEKATIGRENLRKAGF